MGHLRVSHNKFANLSEAHPSQLGCDPGTINIQQSYLNCTKGTVTL